MKNLTPAINVISDVILSKSHAKRVLGPTKSPKGPKVLREILRPQTLFQGFMVNSVNLQVEINNIFKIHFNF